MSYNPLLHVGSGWLMTRQWRAAAVVGSAMCVTLLLLCRQVTQRVLLEDEIQGMTYGRAESKMHQAYSEAHRFESKASAQRRYEEEDEEIKAKLIKIARERADALRAEDKRSEKVEGIRERLEDALAATQQTLGLRAKRLDQLKAQVGRSERDAERSAKQQGELKASKRQMDSELDKLKSNVDEMKANLKLEGEEASDPKEEQNTAKWDQENQHWLKMRRMEEKRADAAEDKGAKASREQAKKHAEALSQQKRADAIEKELVLCSEKGKCDESKKKDLKEQLSEVKQQVSELEKEALYDSKEVHIMKRTEQIRQSQAKADEYKARGYRSKLEAAYTRLKLLKEKVKGAPAALHTAELNERLAEQSDERVGERLKISAEKQETDEALIRKDLAMERVVRRKIAEVKPLERTQIKAVKTASKAAMSEDRVVDRESSQIHGIMQKSRDIQRSANMHGQVAERWTTAAMSELHEAKAFGQVAEELIGARNMEGLKRESGFEAGQMRHGLELMIAKNALRRYLRNKTAANRRYLARVRGDIYRRLGVSDDAAQNEMGIREIDEISRALEGSGRRGAGAEEEERRGRRWSRSEGDERETR